MKRIIGFIIPLLTCGTLFAQDYVMFQSSILKLRSGENGSPNPLKSD